MLLTARNATAIDCFSRNYGKEADFGNWKSVVENARCGILVLQVSEAQLGHGYEQASCTSLPSMTIRQAKRIYLVSDDDI